MGRFCMQCGRELSESMAFCPNCGAKCKKDIAPASADDDVKTYNADTADTASETPADIDTAQDAPKAEEAGEAQDAAKTEEASETQDIPKAEETSEAQDAVKAEEAGEAQDAVKAEETAGEAAPATKSAAESGAAPGSPDNGNGPASPVADDVKNKIAGITAGKKKLIAVCAAAAVILICIIAFAVTRPKVIDLNEYTNPPEFSGIDGDGRASVSFDDELYTEVEKAAKDSGKLDDFNDVDDWDDLDDLDDSDFEDMFSAYDLISSPATITVSPNDGLSNGDEVTVSYEYDNEQLKELGIKLKGKETTYTVEGLTEAIEIDAFSSDIFNVSDDEKGVHLLFTGISPDASLEISNDLPQSDDLSGIIYHTEPSTGISSGDKIVITAELPEEMTVAGYILKEEETTITCDNVPEYLTSLDDIDQESWDKIKEQCDDIKMSRIDQEDWWVTFAEGAYRRPAETSNFQYKKAYLLNRKAGADTWFSANNVLKIEFQIDCAKTVAVGLAEEDSHQGITGVFTLEDIVKNASGEIEFNVTDIHLEDGYEKESSLIQEEINAEAEDYNSTEMDLNWSE